MKSKRGIEIKSIDAYIANQPQQFREMLEELRFLVKSIIPEASELISYQIACFHYHYLLVGIGTNKKYCSFYTMSPKLVNEMKNELKDIKLSGTTLHLMPGQPIPKLLISKIVKARIKENEERAKAKKK